MEQTPGAKRNHRPRSTSSTKRAIDQAVPPSPYRSAQWTVSKLRSELRQRNLSATGRKEELLARLEKAQPTADTPYRAPAITELMESDAENGEWLTRRDRGRSRARRPDEALELLNYQESTTGASPVAGHDADEMTLWRSPLWTLQYFVLAIIDLSHELVRYCTHHRITIATIMTTGFFLVAARMVKTPYQGFIVDLEESFIWYSKWIIFGIASSVGLGTGLHTFVLFLAPLIARITIHAYKCGSLEFSIRDDKSFNCNGGDKVQDITLSGIYFKVFFESFLWGAGTAIGELPPYFVARAAALAGKEDEEFSSIEELKNKPKKLLSYWERVQLFMFYMMQRMGFIGILLSASIPNPLFDLAGITCGHFLIPFSTFFGATFIGKALIKAAIQTWFVILLFSEESISWFLQVLGKYNKSWYTTGHEFFMRQKSQFSRESRGDSDGKGVSLISLFWNGFIALMIAYFLASIVQSLAVSRLRKERRSAASEAFKRENVRSRLRKRAIE